MGGDRPTRSAGQHTRYTDGTRPRAAGQRLARAALPDAHGYVVGSVDAHELRVDPAREGGMTLDLRPDTVTLVAENADEITTEGGLDVNANLSIVRAAVNRLRQGGILASLFIDPDAQQVEAAHAVNAQQVELCTAAYAEATLGARAFHSEGALRASRELRRLREAATFAAQYGLHVAAGHGLTYRNVGAVAEINEITEFNIGHNIIARSIFVGLEQAVLEMREAITAGSAV